MSPSAPAPNERREFASELKFVLDPQTAQRVREWARQHLIADPNARGATGDTYRVASLYFDTAQFAVYQRDARLRYSKFRIRRYDEAVLFVERKLKVSGRIAKRRTTITPADLARMAATPAPLAVHSATWAAAWFEHKTAARRLRPVCQIDYFRTARVLATPDGPIRLTLDENIRAQPAHEAGFLSDAAAVPLTDRVVLELKFRRDLPVLFRTLAAEFGLNPGSFSKYRHAVEALALAPLAAPESATDDTAAASAAIASAARGASGAILPASLLACPTS